MKIKVKELVGENAMTLDDGEAIYNRIHGPLVEGQTVELDFEGVEVFSSPFFNAGVGRLLADLRPEALKTGLKIEHLSDFGQRVLRRVIDNAKEYYAASPDHRHAIDRIVQDTAAAM
ncbi:hypothetical protein MTYM_00660 [Methylococcales bacterium]|nr:hypothetical protein MTYM_00660 [Methylococcales bacterium]